MDLADTQVLVNMLYREVVMFQCELDRFRQDISSLERYISKELADNCGADGVASLLNPSSPEASEALISDITVPEEVHRRMGVWFIDTFILYEHTMRFETWFRRRYCWLNQQLARISKLNRDRGLVYTQAQLCAGMRNVERSYKGILRDMNRIRKMAARLG